MNAQRILPAAMGLLLAISAPLAVNAAATKTPNLNGKFCKDLGGTWASGKAPSCTISTSVSVSSDFTIPTKVTLMIASGGTVDIQGGFVINDGTISIASGGTFTITSSEDFNAIFANDGTVANSGTMTIANSGTESTGLRNNGTFTNNADGTVTISNSGAQSKGIENFNSFNNHGTLAATNSGSDSFGLFATQGGTFNAGSMTIETGFAADYGIYDSAPVFSNNNGGTITLISGHFGNFANGLTFNNSSGATITVNSGAFFENNGQIDNFGTIVINSGGIWQTLAVGSCTNTGTGTGCP